jgi:hypothetical protein
VRGSVLAGYCVPAIQNVWLAVRHGRIPSLPYVIAASFALPLFHSLAFLRGRTEGATSF